MKVHTLLAALSALALLAGCRSAPAPLPSTALAADPDRWDRALCRLGAYPESLDAAALARARQDDLQAAWSGLPVHSAFSAMLAERSAFDARCAAWRGVRAKAEVGAVAQQGQASP